MADTSVGSVLIAAVPASTIIVVIVQAAKKLGMDSRFAVVLSIVLGVSYTMVAHAVQLLPALREWYDAAGAGLTIGLTASGLYSGAKALTGVRQRRARHAHARAHEVAAGQVVPALGDGRVDGKG